LRIGSRIAPRRFLVLGWLIAVLCLFGLPQAGAHELRPAVVTASAAGSDRLEFEVKANLEALIARIPPSHSDTAQSPSAAAYDALRALAPAELESRFRAFQDEWIAGIAVTIDGKPAELRASRVMIPEVGDTRIARISTVVLTTARPPSSSSFDWKYAAKFGASVLRLKAPTGEVAAVGWFHEGAQSPAVALDKLVQKSSLAVFADYVVVGFTHILPKGLDHILFVLGLYFLNPAWRPLLMQVTAFTLAHSITLALGLYGVVQISPAIVEPLIAASIVYVAVENLTTSKMTFWRPFIVFAFGLLHGLGFAGVLQEFGLPQQDYVVGLIGFNVGVEAGQLAVIALAWCATGLWFASRSWYRHRIAWPASICIAMVGAYWTFERVLGW
jgi:hypothetical protein